MSHLEFAWEIWKRFPTPENRASLRAEIVKIDGKMEKNGVIAWAKENLGPSGVRKPLLRRDDQRF